MPQYPQCGGDSKNEHRNLDGWFNLATGGYVQCELKRPNPYGKKIENLQSKYEENDRTRQREEPA